MSLTQKYVSVAGGGSHDGSSGNAWTWAEMLAASGTLNAGGFKINIISGTTYTIATAALETLPAGLATAPNIYRGYSSTIDDLEANNRSAGRLVTTGFPLIDYTNAAGGITFGANIILEHLRIEGVRTSSGGLVTMGAANGSMRRCRLYNKATSGGSSSCGDLTTQSTVIDCDFKAGNASAPNCISIDRGVAIDCLFEGVTSADGVVSGTYGAVINCRFTNCLNAIVAGGASAWVFVRNCSFWKSTTADIVLNAGFAEVSNCLSWGNAGSTKFVSAASVLCTLRSNNTNGNHGAADANVGDWPQYSRSTSLAADPFTDGANGDFSLTTAGKTAVAGLGRVPYQDLGAIQQQASASSGTHAYVFGG